MSDKEQVLNSNTFFFDDIEFTVRSFIGKDADTEADNVRSIVSLLRNISAKSAALTDPFAANPKSSDDLRTTRIRFSYRGSEVVMRGQSCEAMTFYKQLIENAESSLDRIESIRRFAILANAAVAAIDNDHAPLAATVLAASVYETLRIALRQQGK